MGYAASPRSVWSRTLAPRSIASQSFISSTRWLRPPLDGMKIIPASVIAVRLFASWPTAGYRCVEGKPSVGDAFADVVWARGVLIASAAVQLLLGTTS